MNSRSTHFQRVVDSLLIHGADDWVHFPEIIHDVQSHMYPETEKKLQDDVMNVLWALVSAGYMEIGDVDNEGFHPWNLPIGDAIAKIETEWNSIGDPQWAGQVCWLASTRQGDQIANLIFERWTEAGNEFPVEIDKWASRDRYGLTEGLLLSSRPDRNADCNEL